MHDFHILLKHQVNLPMRVLFVGLSCGIMIYYFDPSSLLRWYRYKLIRTHQFDLSHVPLADCL